MVARTLILFFITAAVLVGFVWLMPLDVVLKARGYTPEQITAVKQLGEPGTAALAVGAGRVGANAAQAGATPAPQPQQAAPAAAQAPNKDQAQQTAQQSEQAAPAPAPAQAETAPPASEPAQPRQFVSTDTINVRAGEGTNTDVVGQLGPRTLVTVVEDTDGDWMKIKSSKVDGWVYKPLFEPKQ